MHHPVLRILERSEARRGRLLQSQVISAFTREACKGGERVIPQVPDFTAGLTPTRGAGKEGLGAGAEPQATAKFRQGFQQVDP